MATVRQVIEPDYAASREIRALVARGVRVTSDDEVCLTFPTEADVQVVYDRAAGFWRMSIDTSTAAPAGAEEQLTIAAYVAEAAAVCRDFNNKVVRRQKRNANAALADEICALLSDRGIDPFDAQTALRMTPGVFDSRITGRTTWTAPEVLRVAALIDPDDPSDVTERLARVAA